MLLLHGSGFDAADFSYRYAIGPLSRLRRVLAFDWPGYGGSDTPDLQYDLAYYVRFLERLMDSLGFRRVALIGTSTGGWSGSFLRAAFTGQGREARPGIELRAW